MRIRVKKGTAGTASETIDVPPVSSLMMLAETPAHPLALCQLTKLKRFSFFQSLFVSISAILVPIRVVPTSPQPLQGYDSSCSIGDSGYVWFSNSIVYMRTQGVHRVRFPNVLAKSNGAGLFGEAIPDRDRERCLLSHASSMPGLSQWVS